MRPGASFFSFVLFVCLAFTARAEAQRTPLTEAPKASAIVVANNASRLAASAFTAGAFLTFLNGDPVFCSLAGGICGLAVSKAVLWFDARNALDAKPVKIRHPRLTGIAAGAAQAGFVTGCAAVVQHIARHLMQ